MGTLLIRRRARPPRPGGRTQRTVWWMVLTAAFVTTTLPAAPPSASVKNAWPTNRAEILWDTWGVPHLFAKDQEALAFAFGWAQMQAHGNLILHLYGESRGRSAEYWGGEENLQRDRAIRTFGIPRLAQMWVEQGSGEFDRFLAAFVAGINAYATEHREALAPAEQVVLPVEHTDVIGHMLRAIHFTFVAGMDGVPGQVQAWERSAGSNAWAVSPQRTANGHALLLANPHLPWRGLFIWFEAHWNCPGLDAYGATLVGLPVLSIAFNQHVGWTHTVNTHDGSDVYELSLDGSGYRWDGQTRPFETAHETLKVRQSNGSLREEPLTIRRSVHGPVIGEKPGRALAIRVVGLESPGLGQQYLEMLRARNLAEFEAALQPLQMPMFTVMYADADGHIMHLFGGQTPVRPPGAYRWSGIVPGDTSATLWTNTLPYARLPRVVDPASGWLQNANDPPWTTTFPQALRRADFPDYLAPKGMALRPQRSAQLLMRNARWTFEELIAAKHDTHVTLADRVLDDLLAAITEPQSPGLRRAAEVLRAWDRKLEVASRGAELFDRFVEELGKRSGGRIPFAKPWDENQPLETPRGLSDQAKAVAALEAAVDQMQKANRPLDLAWGDSHRVRRGDLELPANGGGDRLGIFRAASFRPGRDGLAEVMGGDSFVCVVEFSRPVRAQASLAYGNSSQPGSRHRTNQVELFSQKKLRPVWLRRAEVEANLEKRESF